MNTIAFEFGKIILTVQDPKEWDLVKLLSGKVEDVAPGVFHFSMSTHNLKRIADHFTGDRKPRVVSGHRFLESLRTRLSDYKEARNRVQDVLSKPQYPVPPNGQFIPYSHQTQIIGVIDANPLSPVLSDCGTGKTGALARAIELVLNRQEIQRGKVLISAPLSILNTSWEDDIKQFTSLRAALLWTPLSNKVSLGEERCMLGEHPPKPVNTITTKTRTGTRHRNPTSGVVKEEITSLDGGGWVKYRATWKVAIDIEGNEYPFGKITGRPVSTEPTRENYIREQLARTDVDVFLINHDGVRIWEKILKEKDFTWVAIDESTKVKSPHSKVFSAHINISWKCKRRNILTGTPNPNSYIDLWSQFYFLDRGMTLEPCLKDFLYAYFTPEIVGYSKTPVGRKANVKYVIRGDREKEALIARVRAPGILLEQRACVDLPKRTDTRRLVYLTSAQEAAYERMERDLVAELTSAEGETLRADAVNVLSKIMKLRQITSGFLLNKEGDSVHVENNPKWQDLDDYIDELGGKKLVIACQFREEIEHLLERYKHLGTAALYGDIALRERTDAIRRFQLDEGDGTRIIILQPAAAAHGITLTAASHLVFCSLSYNFEHYYQTAKRIERIGQKSPIFVAHLLARLQSGESTIDEDLFEVLQVKGDDRTALFGSTQSLQDVSRVLTQKLIAKAKAKK